MNAISESQWQRFDLVKVAHAALLAKLHVKTVYRLIAAGRIPVYGARGRLRIHMSDLLPKVDIGGRE